MGLPDTAATPLVRTHFGDDAAWARLAGAVLAENEDGFSADLTLIDDAAFAGVSIEALSAMIAERDRALLIVADATTFESDESLLLCIDGFGEHPPLRVGPALLWSIENNIEVGSMDFSMFAEATIDGVYRGFD